MNRNDRGKTMEIIISRDSVCAGDDVNNHQVTLIFTEESTYVDVINRIIEDKYLPNVYGDNVVWVLKSKEYSDILSYYTKTKRVFNGLAIKRLTELCKNSNTLHFKYFTSPVERKKYINALYKNSTYEIWRDGWLEEYQYCDFLSDLI